MTAMQTIHAVTLGLSGGMIANELTLGRPCVLAVGVALLVIGVVA